eukprot:CAMPEP_0170259248 /NCGR_PEP_ID=MMETSP0116_2-20130129/29495_1 /TAXON_ID=400756 /ORGANISM="Durinskia baltica, Strain CSIRO CS-38" /LENGTH=345 /DNA_ID=CAMNT_0010510293 /DNA_START=8 /DNA_END=1045 /DNA_ORIENTATION=+
MTAPASPMSTASMFTLPLDDDSDVEVGPEPSRAAGGGTPGLHGCGRVLSFAAVPTAPAVDEAMEQPRSQGLPVVRMSSAAFRDDSSIGKWSEEEPSPAGSPRSISNQRLAFAVIAASGMDLLASSCLAGSALSTAVQHCAVSLWCVGLQALSHLFSSFVLAAQLANEQAAAARATDCEGKDAEPDDCTVLEERRLHKRREQLLAVTMGLAMLLSCAGLLYKALSKLQRWEQWYTNHEIHDQRAQAFTEAVACAGFGVYILHFMLRSFAAWRLRSNIAWHGVIVSAISALFFLVLIVASTFQREWSWKVEPIVAIILLCIMSCESIRMLLSHITDVETVLARKTAA